MKKIIFILSLLSISTIIISCSGCKKEDYKFNYQIIKNSTSKNLLFFCYPREIYGIDTTDFSLQVHIHVDNMTFGGVAKLPTGGIAFSHSRWTKNNAWGRALYVTDDKYNVIKEVPICYSPMAPKVVNNTLMIGSSAIEEGGKYIFQVYNTNDFSLKKEFIIDDMIDRWRIISNGDKAYFGVFLFTPNSKSYIMQLDINTSDTVSYRNNNDFFKQAGINIFKKGNLLYIYNVVEKNICLFDINTKSIQKIIKVSEYPQIASLKVRNLFHPTIINNCLHGFLEDWGDLGKFRGYWVKFDANTFELLDLKPLETPDDSSTGASYQGYYGSFFVMQFEKKFVFVKTETGEIVGRCDFSNL